MKSKNRLIFYSSVIFISIVGNGIYYVHDNRKKDKIISELRKEYPPINIETELNGLVKQIPHPYISEMNNNPNSSFIILDNGTKADVMVGFEMTNQETIDELLEINDYVLKISRSNIFNVFKIEGRDTLKYSFFITDELGYPLKIK